MFRSLGSAVALVLAVSGCSTIEKLEPDTTPTNATAVTKSMTPNSSGDLLSSITDYFAKKKTDETMKDIGDKPIFSFSSEVKSHKVEPVHDPVFLPTKNYALAK